MPTIQEQYDAMGDESRRITLPAGPGASVGYKQGEGDCLIVKTVGVFDGEFGALLLAIHAAQLETNVKLQALIDLQS